MFQFWLGYIAGALCAIGLTLLLSPRKETPHPKKYNQDFEVMDLPKEL